MTVLAALAAHPAASPAMLSAIAAAGDPAATRTVAAHPATPARVAATILATDPGALGPALTSTSATTRDAVAATIARLGPARPRRLDDALDNARWPGDVADGLLRVADTSAAWVRSDALEAVLRSCAPLRTRAAAATRLVALPDATTRAVSLGAFLDQWADLVPAAATSPDPHVRDAHPTRVATLSRRRADAVADASAHPHEPRHQWAAGQFEDVARALIAAHPAGGAQLEHILTTDTCPDPVRLDAARALDARTYLTVPATYAARWALVGLLRRAPSPVAADLARTARSLPLALACLTRTDLPTDALAHLWDLWSGAGPDPATITDTDGGVSITFAAHPAATATMRKAAVTDPTVPHAWVPALTVLAETAHPAAAGRRLPVTAAGSHRPDWATPLPGVAALVDAALADLLPTLGTREAAGVVAAVAAAFTGTLDELATTAVAVAA